MIKKILSFIFLLFFLFLIIFGIILEKSKDKEKNSRVIGTWYEESGMAFTFSNHEFYWYKDFQNLKNNYYKGTIEIKSLCDFHLTEKQIKEEYGDIDCKDYYELKLYPKVLESDAKKEKYKGNYYLKFALYYESKNDVYLYDFTKEKFYVIAKLNNF